MSDSLEDFIRQVFPQQYEELCRKREKRIVIVKKLRAVTNRVQHLPSSDETQAIFRDILELVGQILLESWEHGEGMEP